MNASICGIPLHKLSDQHRNELLESGIPTDRVDDLGHRTGTAAEVNEALGRKDLNGGLIFEYLNIDGTLLTCKDGRPFNRVKTLESDRTAYQVKTGKKLGKYLSRFAEGCRIYFGHGVDPAVYQSHLTPLYETEGEKKVDALTAHGKVAIGFGGVDSWKDSCPRPGEVEREIEEAKKRLQGTESIADESKRSAAISAASADIARWEKVRESGKLESSRPLPELDQIKYRHRQVFQAYDSDLIRNKAVQNAVVSRAERLIKQGADPRCLVLPTEMDEGKNGVDDFIRRHGIEALTVLEKLAPPTLVLSRKEWVLNPEVLEPNEGYKAAMLSSVLKEEWAYRPDIGYYRRTKTHWQQESESILLVYVQLFMDIHGWQRRSAGAINSIVEELRKRLTVPERFWNPDHLLVFLNGTLDTRTEKFVGTHNKSDYCTMALPFEWNPFAPCDRWLQFVNEATARDYQVVQLLRAFTRWTLEPKPDAKFSIEKSLEMFGPKGTGKSTFLEIVQALIGEENVGSADIDTFKSAENLVQLVDKRLACSSDINGFMPDIGVFNRVVSNERVQVRHLYTTAKTIRLGVVVMRAYNAHVSVPSGSEGLDRRLCVVGFNIRPEHKDPNLLDKLKSELSGIFQWAWSMPMAEAAQIIQNSGEIESVKQASIDRFEADNPEYAFLADAFPDGNDNVRAADLYQSFKSWCDENGRKPSNNNTFGERIEKFGCCRSRSKLGRFWSIPAMSDFDVAEYMGISKSKVETDSEAAADQPQPVSEPAPTPQPTVQAAPTVQTGSGNGNGNGNGNSNGNGHHVDVYSPGTPIRLPDGSRGVIEKLDADNKYRVNLIDSIGATRLRAEEFTVLPGG